MSTPYQIVCQKCGASWWDAHVCAQDVKIKPTGLTFVPWSKEVEMRESWKAAQPDCRTCVHIAVRKDNCFQGCTNGDKYIEAPKVVLWGTK
jgi:hypothetical protein